MDIVVSGECVANDRAQYEFMACRFITPFNEVGMR